ncbi:MAG: ATPase, partial [Rubrivivax sp.]|nr:ATPase [Rubrivivax sp.]
RMLSNFQFGTQALLQSFLVGQPEFREILQRPEMEQFRQRVAASCHIGPLDADETRGYVEHRLKKAGSTGLPVIETDAFDAIHAASRGIPRRINSVCDRLLLLGFLADRTTLTAADVAEVVREFEQEAYVPPKRAAPPPAAAKGADAPVELDLDLSRLELDPATSEAVTRQLAQLSAEQRMDQIQRLERSLLRVERTQVQILTLMKTLVEAVKRPADAQAPEAPRAAEAQVPDGAKEAARGAGG